jgi:hypothetical protein
MTQITCRLKSLLQRSHATTPWKRAALPVHLCHDCLMMTGQQQGDAKCQLPKHGSSCLPAMTCHPYHRRPRLGLPAVEHWCKAGGLLTLSPSQASAGPCIPFGMTVERHAFPGDNDLSVVPQGLHDVPYRQAQGHAQLMHSLTTP